MINGISPVSVREAKHWTWNGSIPDSSRYKPVVFIVCTRGAGQ
ncbi:MAG: hypothetical protein ACKO2L_18720 [Planctomycetaceae bacterium]